MKLTFFYILAFLLSGPLSFSQDVDPPRILVITPEEVVLHESLETSSSEYEDTLSDEDVADCIEYNLGDDDRDFMLSMIETVCEFQRNSDVASTFTVYLNDFLSYRLYGVFDSAIIYPLRDTSVLTIEDYNILARQFDVNWIVNLKQLEFQKAKEGFQGSVCFEVWNLNTNSITLSDRLEIDDQNRGFETACETGTMSCLLTNGVADITRDVLANMFSKKEYWF